MSFENDIDSNHRIIHGVIPDLLPVEFVQKQTKTSPYLDLFVWMLCRIYEKIFFYYWFLTQK